MQTTHNSSVTSVARVASETLQLRSNQYLSLLFSALNDLDVQILEIDPASVLKGVIDVIHIHWPENLLKNLNKRAKKKALFRFLLALLIAKKKGIPIVWTVHNSRPHESITHPVLLATFYWLFPRIVDGCIYMSRETQGANEALYPMLASKPSTIIPHGHYKDVVVEPGDPMLARIDLGIPDTATLISHCGLIRDYKNTLGLIRAFRDLDDKESFLLIAGNCKDKYLKAQLDEAINGAPRIQFINNQLSDEEISAYISAADLVALPYKKVTNSGAALYALSLSKPIIAPRMGAFIDLERDHPSWIYLYDGDINSSVLSDAISWQRERDDSEHLDLSIYDWSEVALSTMHFYRRLKQSKLRI